MGVCSSLPQDFKTLDKADYEDLKSSFSNYKIEGKVCLRGDKDYDIRRYQYATTSHNDGTMKPAAIVYAKNEEDVKKVVRYALANDIAIAIRTGGHQYSGCSSTYGKNIQLDLSSTFTDFKYFEAADGSPRVRLGISFPLLKVNRKLGELGLFMPHGECENVHVGGHAQSGGYGQLQRAFGLFSDHIREFDIICADAEKHTVTRESDPDLFYAVLGGSPGNFGVVTHIVIAPHRDSDHPHSRGYLATYLYETERFRRLLELLAEWANDPNWPKDFDYTINVMSFHQDFFDLHPNMDAYVRKKHPEAFGTKNGGAGMTMNAIVIFAQWANLGGKNQPYDESVAEWFQRIKSAAEGINLSSIPLSGKFIPLVEGYVDNAYHTPISQLTKRWVLAKVREYDLPYYKSAHGTDDVITPDYVNFLVERVDEVQKHTHGLQCKLLMQLQATGKTSTVRDNAGNGTSYNFRKSRFGYVGDIFYAPKGKEYAEKWHLTNEAKMIGPNGLFSKRDIRFFWGSFGNRNLPEVVDLYYEDPAIYERVLKIKEKVDPHKIFSSNEFSVGGMKHSSPRIEDDPASVEVKQAE